MDFTMDVDTEFVVTQSIRSTACGPLAKLKRKRSSEHLMLRHTLKRKVFVKDSQYTPNDAEICSSKVHDVNMNISVSVENLLTIFSTLPWDVIKSEFSKQINLIN